MTPHLGDGVEAGARETNSAGRLSSALPPRSWPRSLERKRRGEEARDRRTPSTKCTGDGRCKRCNQGLQTPVVSSPVTPLAGGSHL